MTVLRLNRGEERNHYSVKYTLIGCVSQVHVAVAVDDAGVTAVVKVVVAKVGEATSRKTWNLSL